MLTFWCDAEKHLPTLTSFGAIFLEGFLVFLIETLNTKKSLPSSV